MENLFKLDSLTIIWLTITVLLLIVSIVLVTVWKKKGTLSDNQRTIDCLPSLLSTFGVLGTFIGITIGLIHFETSDIDASIPKLLDGLKTAFFTSLAGMGCSMILQQIISFVFDRAEKKSDISIASQKIVEAVEEMKNVLSKQSSDLESVQTNFYKYAEGQLSSLGKGIDKMLLALNGISSDTDNISTISESLASINKSVDSVDGYSAKILKGEDELNSSLKSYIAKFDTGIADLQGQMSGTNVLLGEKFDEFSQLLKKSNTEALVEVMKKVTEEFQKQMNDLIGRLVKENFQQLNDSVKRLNDWQLENKEMIQKLTSQYVQMTNSFEKTSTTLDKVGKDTTVLVSDGSKLDQIVKALNEVMVDDQRFVEMGVNLTESAESVRDANASFNDSAQKLSNWVLKQKDFNENVNVLIKKLDDINKINDYASTFWSEARKGMNDSVGILQTGSKNLQQQINGINQSFYERLSATLGNLDDLMTSWLKNNRR